METRTRGRTLRRRGLISLLGAASLVLASAGPASAQTATVGSGAGTGWEYVPETFEECGLPPSGVGYPADTFVLNHESTYESVDTSNSAVATYVGPARMTITTGPVTQAPQGAANGICPNGAGTLVPTPVDITDIVIDGTSPLGGSIHCEGQDNGFYTRINSTVVFEFEVVCDITGNVVAGTVQNAPVRHVVEGNQTPCFPLPCPQDPVNPDPYYGTNEAASSHMETAFEAEGPA